MVLYPLQSAQKSFSLLAMGPDFFNKPVYSHPFNVLAANVKKEATSSTGANLDCLCTYSYPRIHILKITVY